MLKKAEIKQFAQRDDIKSFWKRHWLSKKAFDLNNNKKFNKDKWRNRRKQRKRWTVKDWASWDFLNQSEVMWNYVFWDDFWNWKSHALHQVGSLPQWTAQKTHDLLSWKILRKTFVNPKSIVSQNLFSGTYHTLCRWKTESCRAHHLFWDLLWFLSEERHLWWNEYSRPISLNRKAF